MGSFLFYDWRFSAEGKKNSGFVLDEPRYKGASILIAGKNFGCGSSREHAVWALADFGFRAVISSSFADIFANNSTKNGFLTVQLTEDETAELMRRARDVEGYQLTVDLEQCEVRDDQGFRAKFPINDFVRHCLLNGLDDIGLTLQHEAEIAAYEATASRADERSVNPRKERVKICKIFASSLTCRASQLMLNTYAF